MVLTDCFASVFCFGPRRYSFQLNSLSTGGSLDTVRLRAMLAPDIYESSY
jgi:hypothetical protein